MRLVKGDTASFERVMLHEIFHILSRNHLSLKKKIYSLLGFNAITKLTLSPFLEKRVLFNPDGLDLYYAIPLADSNNNIHQFVPVIYAKHGSYRFENGSFFNQLIFQLFEISEDGMIISNDIGVDPNSLASFWHKITRNTNYIIHPDELAADNYVYVIYWKSTPDQTVDRFGKNGQQLLEDIFRRWLTFRH